MAVSLNGKLNNLADTYYISYGSPEQKKIDSSVATLKARLKTYFGNDITNMVEFGSYKRDTLLPRKFDEHSDVDLMIYFNHASINVTPGTYRDRLVKFAGEKYSTSGVYKSSPTVVLELDHIKYDLVPAYETSDFFSRSTYIPRSDNAWMETDPNGFNRQLTSANIANHSNIKKVIRLLKAWNAKMGYPMESFALETEIVGMSFWLFDTALQSYFFSVISQLLPYEPPNFVSTNPRIIALKENAKRVENYLSQDNISAATTWLGHILPL